MTGDALGPAPADENSRRRLRATDDRPVTDGIPPRPPLPAAIPARPALPGQAPAEGAPAMDAPTPDVSPTQEPSAMPGAHRGGFQRLPTAPVDVTVQSAPAEPGTEKSSDSPEWRPAEAAPLSRGVAGWALGFGILGLAISLFVGWGFPLGIVAVVAGIIALRRPLDSRPVAVWAICIGGLSILYSAGWLLFAAAQAELIR